MEQALARASVIRESGVSIYDDLGASPELVFQDSEIEYLVLEELTGANLDLPARSRAKVAKGLVARALGYPVPPSFRKVQPRFPGQDLDVYVQKGDNLQIWNEDISPNRRYVLIRPCGPGGVPVVKVVRGEQIALWDTTGTLTSKYQAKRIPGRSGSLLVSPEDTDRATQLVRRGTLTPIRDVYRAVQRLEGRVFDDPGVVQDRRRGEMAQELVATALGVDAYENRGQWPDIVPELVEVKLQTSPTLDLGLVLPSSEKLALIGGGLRHCDVRYVVLYGSVIAGGRIEVSEVVVSTGIDFFGEFQRFEGLVQSRKLQIPLPRSLLGKAE